MAAYMDIEGSFLNARRPAADENSHPRFAPDAMQPRALPRQVVPLGPGVNSNRLSTASSFMSASFKGGDDDSYAASPLGLSHSTIFAVKHNAPHTNNVPAYEPMQMSPQQEEPFDALGSSFRLHRTSESPAREEACPAEGDQQLFVQDMHRILAWEDPMTSGCLLAVPMLALLACHTLGASALLILPALPALPLLLSASLPIACRRANHPLHAALTSPPFSPAAWRAAVPRAAAAASSLALALVDRTLRACTGREPTHTFHTLAVLWACVTAGSMLTLTSALLILLPLAFAAAPAHALLAPPARKQWEAASCVLGGLPPVGRFVGGAVGLIAGFWASFAVLRAVVAFLPSSALFSALAFVACGVALCSRGSNRSVMQLAASFAGDALRPRVLALLKSAQSPFKDVGRKR